MRLSRALSSRTTAAVLIRSPYGSAFVQSPTSISSEVASKQRQQEQRQQQDDAITSLKAVIEDASADPKMLTREEILRGGKHLGLSDVAADKIFSRYAHNDTARVSEGDFLTAVASAFADQNFSFTSPESDWCAARPMDLLIEDKLANESTNDSIPHLSFASPESDFTALRPEEYLVSQQSDSIPHLSFASPESDFTALRPEEYSVSQQSLRQPPNSPYEPLLSFASPESDFTAMTSFEVANTPTWSEVFVNFPSVLSFSSPESDFAGLCSMPPSKSPMFREKDLQQREVLSEERTLLTLQKALAPSTEARVLTKAAAPFEICHVNGAWTNLCGFSLAETTGRTLSIIQGEDTVSSELDSLVESLIAGRGAEAVLTNYTAQGRPFRNHLKVHPVRDAGSGELTHFLGILKEIDASVENRMAAGVH